ncbi:MAG: gamma-glutamyl-gamma-aminobutyrate hydrolase family protein [Rhodobiaceae bacterium]|jgi:putative glutamine amidotransferase|nr:gamma-glutamyl-gamma-aminobutyrate hydrolase family protein [Rhodobiaceae bacterium]MDG2496179.1 gamma-glutamyl-gamma-aminobutyrate hydrolase family protein [Alphaproteobacteria bacterium]
MLLGIICNEKTQDLDTLQAVNHLYLRAVAEHMDVQPVLIPAAMAQKNAPTPKFNADRLLDRLDGLLITGNRSNIHPSHYGAPATPAHEPFDRNRDAVAFALIQGALDRDLPLLTVCRGMQELNIVCGGSLATDIHTQPGKLDHRTPKGDSLKQRYVARHRAQFLDNGYFHNLLGVAQAQTNSLHWQAIDQLGDDLIVEAQADDGTIEAVRHSQASHCIGVQWHPEYQTGENIISAKLFGDLGRAMQER